jgi:hypothetical protein
MSPRQATTPEEVVGRDREGYLGILSRRHADETRIAPIRGAERRKTSGDADHPDGIARRG